MTTTLESYTDYIAADPDPAITTESLRNLEQRVLAYVLPREPRTELEIAAVEFATYEQARSQTLVGSVPDDARLRSFKIGEMSMTLESTGLTREQALFPGGLCAGARALLMSVGLMYRGVSA